ncbi:hypothetical protein ACFX16_040777 [Malus domestica]
MAISLDLAEEKREQLITRIATYKQQLLSSHNKRAKIRQFQPIDLVLRKDFITAHREGSKKIVPIWESPYKISRVGGKSNYTPAMMNNKEIEKQWNAYNMRKYHALPPTTSKLEDSSSSMGTTSQAEDYPVVMQFLPYS